MCQHLITYSTIYISVLLIYTAACPPTTYNLLTTPLATRVYFSKASHTFCTNYILFFWQNFGSCLQHPGGGSCQNSPRKKNSRYKKCDLLTNNEFLSIGSFSLTSLILVSSYYYQCCMYCNCSLKLVKRIRLITFYLII